MGRCATIQTATAFILLGATGDLAQKKLLPALIDLFEKGVLPKHFYILAFSRSSLDTAGYREFVRKHIEAKGKQYTQKNIEDFLELIEYTQGNFDEPAAFERTKEILEVYDERIGTCSSKLFYLAVPPQFYDTIFEQLARVKLEQACMVGDGWTRILVEKPFGSNLENAQYLDEKLNKLFHEEQIYRIDHYLAKSALQNIIAFRFSNVLFEDKWNNEYIEAVYITLSETIDVTTRGAFFDKVGALRDVGQNHILQMLTLIAMDHPEKLEASNLRQKRAEILEALRIPTHSESATDIVKGQYEGYQYVKDVEKASKTETYFLVKAFLDTPRWQGVPFYLEHGKSLSKSETAITVRFRSAKNCVCNEGEKHNHQNIVRFTISPEQKISVQFWVRKQGLKYELQPRELLFDRTTIPQEDRKLISDPYEEVLFDALCGDQTLFVSNKEQHAAWKYITAILELWEDVVPLSYASGSFGPESNLKKEIEESLLLT
ncbi:MAG: Glucose-6-phosphate 1-dehydrogenase [Parcubacteria group bacterium GW2011_GWA2_43_11]|nr:MAG: Glucose-6-phosphate 1-dehydrogenase [Parcubacteria group bacterium GW2011_GWA2_43_11]